MIRSLSTNQEHLETAVIWARLTTTSNHHLITALCPMERVSAPSPAGWEMPMLLKSSKANNQPNEKISRSQILLHQSSQHDITPPEAPERREKREEPVIRGNWNMVWKRNKRGGRPSPYPRIPFHALRAGQLLSSIVVSGIMGYFMYYLREYFTVLSARKQTNVRIAETWFRQGELCDSLDVRCGMLALLYCLFGLRWLTDSSFSQFR